MIVVWSPKGGAGTSVLAAALALRLARTGGARIADLAGDQPSVLAFPDDPAHGIGDWLASGPGTQVEALDRLAVEAAPGLALLPAGRRVEAASLHPGAGGLLAAALTGGVPTVVDAGRGRHPAAGAAADAARHVLLVTRPCYLALRRAVGHPLTAASTGVVVVEEAGRPLRPRDVGEVLGLPVLARVPLAWAVARAVDAGTLPARLPDVLDRAAARLLERLDPHTNGRVA